MTACNKVPEDVKSRTAEQNEEIIRTYIDSEGNEKIAEKIGSVTFACDPDPINTSEFYILRSPTKEKYDPEKDYSSYIQKMNKAAQELFGFEVKEDEHFEFSYYKENRP